MIYKFDPLIYPRMIWITYDATSKELNEEFPNGDGTGKMFTDNDLESSYATTYSVGTIKPESQGGFLLRFESKESMTSWIIAHECIHAATGIFSYIGADVNVDNEEPFAYLVSWIIKCCERVKEGMYRIGEQ